MPRPEAERQPLGVNVKLAGNRGLLANDARTKLTRGTFAGY